jgi:hypothetical protein
MRLCDLYAYLCHDALPQAVQMEAYSHSALPNEMKQSAAQKTRASPE